MPKQLIAHLKGGLGNQMFEYAAARAIALRNQAPLFLDDYSGFARDVVYKRSYELGAFPINASLAGFSQRVPYFAEKVRNKLVGLPQKPITRRLLWTAIEETAMEFIPEVADYTINGTTWMHGFWQSEKYFSDFADTISKELMPPPPSDKKFLDCAELMRAGNSVSLGVRLFEEVPGASKEGVGGLTPMIFFNDSLAKIRQEINNPRFFVFCTTNSPQLKELDLPVDTVFITHDNGFHGATARLWLYAQCRNHIIANSSFYWWGAWLSEATNKDVRVIASPMFSNADTIPARWLSS